MTITYTALLRKNNIPPIIFIGKLYDKIYPDDYIYHKFPVMRDV